MARRHYWQFLVTDEGNPIENAEITIYIAGTEDPAYVYTDEYGPAGSSTAPQVRTSRKGFYEFWVADKQEPNGYFLESKFKIAWSAVGVQKGYIDYVDVFSTSVAQIDITDVNEYRNKAVSNYLGKGWEDHKNSILYKNNILSIHGMGPVDEAQYDMLIDTNRDLNRLVSNVLAYNWESHANSVYSPTGWVYTMAGAPAPLPSRSNPHGMVFVDVTSSTTEKNALVSNLLAKQWYDHRTNIIAGSADHPQFSHLEGDRPYIHPVGYVNSSIVLSATENDFITKGYVNGWKFELTIATGDWTNNGNGTFSFPVPHMLNKDYPVVTLWELTGKTVVQQESIFSATNNVTTITVTEVGDYYVTVLSCG